MDKLNSSESAELDGFYSPSHGPAGPNTAPTSPKSGSCQAPASADASAAGRSAGEATASLQQDVATLREKIDQLAHDFSLEMRQDRAQLSRMADKLSEQEEQFGELRKQILAKLDSDRLSTWMSSSCLKEATTELRDMIMQQATIIGQLQSKVRVRRLGCGQHDGQPSVWMHALRWLESLGCCCGPRRSGRGLYEAFDGHDDDDDERTISTPLSRSFSAMSRGLATPVLNAQQASERVAAGVSRFSIVLPPDERAL